MFEPDSVRVQPIRVDQEYQGQRVALNAYLGKARIPQQIDIGFGDIVTPSPQEVAYPTLLPFPAPRVRVYSKETVVAEKFHAVRGKRNEITPRESASRDALSLGGRRRGASPDQLMAPTQPRPA